VAPEFLLEAAPFVPVDPAEDPGEGGRRRAVRDPVAPVLGEAVLLGHRAQARGADRQGHGHVRAAAAAVVAPQRSHRLLRTPFTFDPDTHKSSISHQTDTTPFQSYFYDAPQGGCEMLHRIQCTFPFKLTF